MNVDGTLQMDDTFRGPMEVPDWRNDEELELAFYPSLDQR